MKNLVLQMEDAVEKLAALGPTPRRILAHPYGLKVLREKFGVADPTATPPIYTVPVVTDYDQPEKLLRMEMSDGTFKDFELP